MASCPHLILDRAEMDHRVGGGEMKRTLTLVAGCFLATSAWSEVQQPVSETTSDILAMVGDREITFPQLNTQLNSTAVVGLSTPALGTPERRTVMLTLLDKAISVNLLYLDAIKKGMQTDPQFKQEMQDYANGTLAGLYRKHYLKTANSVSEKEIADYIEKHFAKGTELDENMRPVVEAKIRKAKYIKYKAGFREHIRAGMHVKIHTEHLQIEDDNLRSDDQMIAEYDHTRMTWGESKKYLSTLNNSINIERRLETLNQLIDNKLLAKKGYQVGLDRERSYLSALDEFNHTRLVNLHRSELVRGMEPTEQALQDYYEKHRKQIAFNEHRKLQMVVLKDEKTAQSILEKIKKGELTIYQAAINHSIDPRAKQTLGDFGWVEEGTGFPALDELAFALEMGELSDPVETPAGWHIVLVTDQRASRYTDIKDDETQLQTRRLFLKERLNEYVVGLRKKDYPVVVYQDNLNRIMQQEAQWIAAKSKEMEANPERARMILDEMRALVE